MDQVPEDGMLVEVGLTEKQYLAALKRIEASTIRGAKRNEDAFKRANSRTTRGFQDVDRAASGAASGGLRMASMQLSQVAQQGAATGNYLQALAIQAPDLALGFGAVGIAAGALIPILYGVASAALGAEEEVEKIDVQGAYSSATSAIEAAREAQDRYTAAIRLTGAAQSEITPEILGSLKLEAEARQALAALEVERLNRQRMALEQNLAASRAQLESLLADVNQGLEFDPNAEFANSEVERARLQAVQDVLAANEDLLASIREQQAELDLVNALIAQGHGEAAEMVDELIKAANAGSQTASAIGSIDFSNALSGAEALAARLDVSLHKAMQIMGVIGAAAQAARDAAAGPVLDPRDPRFDPVAAEMQRIQDEGYGTVSPFDPSRLPKVPRVSSRGGSSGGRGGGRGGMSDEQRKAEKERNRLLSERDRILRRLETPYQEYERKLADLNELEKIGELTTQQYNAALAQLDEELMQTEFGAVIDGIESVSDALADAIVNGENMGEALAEVFRGIARDLISSGIRSLLLQTFGFGSGSGGGGLFGGLIGSIFGGGRAAGGTVRAGTGYMVGENGPEPFFPAVNGRILSTQQAQQALRGPSGAAGGEMHVRVSVDNDGNLQAFVERTAGRVSSQSVRAGISQYDRQLPERITQYRRDPRARF